MDELVREDGKTQASASAVSSMPLRSISIRLLTNHGVPTNPACTPSPDPGHTHQTILVPVRMRSPQNFYLSF